MGKKMLPILLSLAAVCALPAAASGWEIDPAGVSFTGKGATTSTLSVSGEPTLTCEGPNHVTGSYDADSKTTGSMVFDFTACHYNVFGLTIACTTGSSGNTVTSSGTFHNVTNGTLTELLVTSNPLTMKCASTTPTILTGSVSGRLSSPSCNTPSTSGTLELANAGGLNTETEGSGNKAAAAFSLEVTLTFSGQVTKTC